MRHAMDELIRDGILARYQGRGMAVLEVPIVIQSVELALKRIG
jgi:DNA-binding GntR family transcriptional regulator